MQIFIDVIKEFSYIIRPLFYNILYLSITASIIGIAIIMVRNIIARKLTPNWNIIIWLLFLIALIMPIKIQSKASIYNIISIENIKDISFSENYDKINYYVENSNDGQKTEMQVKNQALLSYIILDILIPFIWFIGMIIMILYIVIGNLIVKKKLKNKTEIPNNINIIFENCKQRLRIKANIEIIIQDYIKTPAIYGLFRKVIILPAEALNLDDKTIEYILMHELSHYKNKDLYINYLLLLIKSIHWFNIVIHICLKKIKEDLEQRADYIVLNNIDEDEYKKYSLSLVEVLKMFNVSKVSPKFIFMADNKCNIEKRIKVIKMKDFFRKKKVVIGIISIVIIVIMSVLFLTDGLMSKPPKLNAISQIDSAMFLTGGYNLKYGIGGKDEVIADSVDLANIKYYNNDNTLYVSSNSSIILDNQRIKIDRKYNFNIKELHYYNIDGKSLDMENITSKVNYSNNEVSILCPEKEGEYIINVVVKYDQGLVNYGLKVIVSNKYINEASLHEIYSNKTKFIGNNSLVSNILNNLPYSVYNSRGFELKTNEKPYTLTIKYSNLEYPTINVLLKNSLILFSTIENAEVVKYDFENDNYTQHTREEIEKIFKIDTKVGFTEKEFIEYISKEADIKIDEYIDTFYDSNIVNLYTKLINHIMEESKGLNGNMEYLSIDTKSFVKQRKNNLELSSYENLSDLEVKMLIKSINKGNYNIKTDSFKDLKNQGLVKKYNKIDGILISVSSVEKITTDEVILTLTKFRSGTAAIMPKYKCKLTDGNWQIEIVSMAIS